MEESFKVKIIYPVTSRMPEIEDEDEELSDIDKIRMRNLGLETGYKLDWGYWDLVLDPILRIEPRCVLKRGSKNYNYYSEVIFQSGNVSYAALKPEDLKNEISEYIRKYPQISEKEDV